MIRRPPRSTLSSSSAASDVYKRQSLEHVDAWRGLETIEHMLVELPVVLGDQVRSRPKRPCHVHQDLTLNPPSKIKFITFQNYYCGSIGLEVQYAGAVSYTHLRAHETPEHLVCRLLLEKKKKK
eukprot:TRINITY_DN19060_c0_g1_i8.p1 TRINITY_DN19060_c0_g1~~TRINITY_DN19060_c0_g1_i8.p1  ORF type:complete len:124 (-),score=40.91 TRINITY_DN19060_c0_g1_i8:27-398(-)